MVTTTSCLLDKLSDTIRRYVSSCINKDRCTPGIEEAYDNKSVRVPAWALFDEKVNNRERINNHVYIQQQTDRSFCCTIHIIVLILFRV